MLRVCRHCHWLHSYVLLVCRQHRRPAFVRIAEPRWYTPLSYIRTRCMSATITTGYIRTCCSSAVYIVDLHSYALQKLVGTHCFPTFIRAARMQTTPLTCVRTRCRTLLVHIAILYSYPLHVCRHYRWLHSYALLVCRQHRRPAFVCVAKPRCYPLLSYIGMCSSSAVNIVHLRSYALQNLIGTHRCRTFVHAARLPALPLATFVCTARLPSTSSTCIRTRCKTSLLPTAVLHSYVLLVCRLHRRPAFVLIAEARWYPLLSYIRTHCSYAVNTADLRSYVLRNLVGTHGCPTFVHAARLLPLPLSTFVRTACLPSTSSTCVRTRCRTSLVHTTVLHSYTLRVYRYCRWLHMYVLHICRQHR